MRQIDIGEWFGVQDGRVQAKALTGRSFYLALMTVITVLILYGFSHTVGADLLRPAATPPTILYVHAITYTLWLGVVMSQTLLIWVRNPRLHRKLGMAAAGFGLFMVVLGVATTLAMGRFDVAQRGPEAAMFIFRPIEDILFFGAAFGLAIYWRKKPDFHRRLMLLAACSVTPPAISRIPTIHSLGAIYVIADMFILAGLFNDLLTRRTVHKVYVWGLSVAVIGQGALLYIMRVQPPSMVAFARFVTQ